MRVAAVFVLVLVCSLFLVAGCGSSAPSGVTVFEQQPSDSPCWYEKQSWQECMDGEDGYEYFIARATQQESRAKADAGAKISGTDQIVSFVCGDLVDGQIDQIVTDGTGSAPDIQTVDIARTVVTLGETGGGVSEYQTYWRHYKREGVDHDEFDVWILYKVDTNLYAEMLADQLEKAAAERHDQMRDVLQNRADRLRESRFMRQGG